MELYKPNRSKRKTKTPERLSSGPTKINQKNEITNLKSKRTNSNSPGHTIFSSENQNPQLQFDFSLNRQYHSNVQHQQKIRYAEPVYDNKENMVYDRQKPKVSKSSSHTRKIKYDNGQIELSRKEWRLLHLPKDISVHSGNTEVLPKNRPICLQEEQTS
jgi:hypothetical protein